MPDAVFVDNLVHRYSQREALAGVSLSVHSGEMFCLLGPNGSGKTTLFRILSTLLRPSSGRAEICGYDVVTQRDEVRRRFGVVFQSPSLDMYLTVKENLCHAGSLYGLRGSDLNSRTVQALENLGVSDRSNDLVKSLSGGLRRRVEIAKCLLHMPTVLLLDEPSTGLDPAARRELWPYLDLVREQIGTTILLTTHHMDEADRCSRLAILDRGRIVSSGTAAELKQRIGGTCITIEADDPISLCEALTRRLGIHPTRVNDRIRIDSADNSSLLADVVSAGGTAIRTVTLGQATLEDVFIHETGRPFTGESV